MEELELQLGNVQTQLMDIRVSYHHSAFPEIANAEPPQKGLCNLQSRMETNATAAIGRKTNSSVWSPRSKALQNSLFPLMVQHWGDEKAISMQRQISDSQMPMSRAGECHAVSPMQQTTSEFPMTFNFNADHPNRTSGLQRYVLDGNSMNPRNPSSGLRTRQRVQLVDGPENSKQGPSTPVRDMYYFGERALRALAPTPCPDGDALRRHQNTNARLKRKDSSFWDWGSWF